MGRLRYHVYWSHHISPHSHVGCHMLLLVLRRISRSVRNSRQPALEVRHGSCSTVEKMITDSGQGTQS
jgi:hypothetical protein